MEERPTYRRGIFRIDVPLLLRQLRLPGDTIIHAARMAFERPETLELVIEHSDLLPSPEGTTLRTVEAEFIDSGFVRWRW